MLSAYKDEGIIIENSMPFYDDKYVFDPIVVNNYDKSFFQAFLVYQMYRLYSVVIKFFNDKLYFIIDQNSIIKIIS